MNSERVYGAPTVPLPYNTPLSPATMVYNVHTRSGDDLLKNVSNLSLNDQASSSPLLAHDRDEKSNKIVLERDIEPLVQKIVENYYIKVKKMKKREIDQKKEGDQKIERRIENTAKEISHKLTTLVQTGAVRVMTDTEITKEIRKKVIRIEIEI